MGLILDTSALVEIERAGQDVRQVLEPYADEAVAIPAVVWAELLVGVRLARDVDVAVRRRAKLEQLRLHVPIVEFDASTAEHYADIFSECSKAGTPIPQNDLAVAATARCLGCKVLVARRDEAHFRCVRDLAVVVLGA